MTSSNGNIFRVTGPLCGEFTGHRWIPAQMPVARSFDFFSINVWVNNREAGDLRRHLSDYDVTVMAVERPKYVELFIIYVKRLLLLDLLNVSFFSIVSFSINHHSSNIKNAVAHNEFIYVDIHIYIPSLYRTVFYWERYATSSIIHTSFTCSHTNWLKIPTICETLWTVYFFLCNIMLQSLEVILNGQMMWWGVLWWTLAWIGLMWQIHLPMHPPLNFPSHRFAGNKRT